MDTLRRALRIIEAWIHQIPAHRLLGYSEEHNHYTRWALFTENKPRRDEEFDDAGSEWETILLESYSDHVQAEECHAPQDGEIEEQGSDWEIIGENSGSDSDSCHGSHSYKKEVVGLNKGMLTLSFEQHEAQKDIKISLEHLQVLDRDNEISAEDLEVLESIENLGRFQCRSKDYEQQQRASKMPLLKSLYKISRSMADIVCMYQEAIHEAVKTQEDCPERLNLEARLQCMIEIAIAARRKFMKEWDGLQSQVEKDLEELEELKEYASSEPYFVTDAIIGPSPSF